MAAVASLFQMLVLLGSELQSIEKYSTPLGSAPEFEENQLYEKANFLLICNI